MTEDEQIKHFAVGQAHLGTIQSIIKWMEMRRQQRFDWGYSTDGLDDTITALKEAAANYEKLLSEGSFELPNIEG